MTDCFDCGSDNLQKINDSSCCPLPVTAAPPLIGSCCQLQYAQKGQIIVHNNKTKFNTQYSVTGASTSLIPNTRIQRGRWNHSYTNTKLHPVIGILTDNSGNRIRYKQAKNIFKNTDYSMTKKERYAYFAKHGRNLKR